MGTETIRGPDKRAQQQRAKDKKRDDRGPPKQDVSIKGTLNAIKERQRLLNEV